MTTERETRTFSLKIAGETREVSVVDTWGDGKQFRTVDLVALCRFRTGSKLWPTFIVFWKQPDGSYKPSMQYSHLNRCSTFVVAWNDEKFANKISKHGHGY